MYKSSCLFLLMLCPTVVGWGQQIVTVGQGGNFVPAGTLLGCTLDEPNFSSKTARTGDPVLCKTTSVVEMFGRQLIPRGAYLSAHLKDYRDPGHFVGKGYIQLEFTGLTLPGGTLPLDAKVISAARYRVNGEGKIQGRGHPTRDAIEWAIPLLWPVKVLTLPARGPRPNLTGETRIELRLMEDLMIPESAYATATSALIPRTSGLQQRPDAGGRQMPVARFASYSPDHMNPPGQQPVGSPAADRYQTGPAANKAKPYVPQPRFTLLVMRGGRTYLVTDYWVDNGKLDYRAGGGLHTMPLDALDMAMTTRLNAERGIPFSLNLGEKNH